MNTTVVLTGAMRERLSDILRTAFTPQRLAEFLEFRLDKRLEDIAMGHDYREIMFRVVRESQREGWTVPLVIAAREMLPGDEALFSIAQELGLAAATPPRPELERMLAAEERFVDVSTFLDRLAAAETAVCRIEVGHDGEIGLGTGFRVAPGLVLTARHILEPVIHGFVRPQDTLMRFGYRRASTGNVVHCGTAFSLAEDWLADSFEDGSADLDYALARLADTPIEATKPLPLQGESGESCIGIPQHSRTPREDRMICILQHPAGDPLKLAFGRTAGITDGATRILHTVNTLPGSSGSPCFDSSLNLIGLHHSGQADSAGCNAAISMAAIAERLVERGVDKCLSF
ncbi:MAG: trypsin-like peptidase domain-containing protein [Pseudonocardiaceae bacterium]